MICCRSARGAPRPRPPSVSVGPVGPAPTPAGTVAVGIVVVRSTVGWTVVVSSDPAGAARSDTGAVDTVRPVTGTVRSDGDPAGTSEAAGTPAAACAPPWGLPIARVGSE